MNQVSDTLDVQNLTGGPNVYEMLKQFRNFKPPLARIQFADCRCSSFRSWWLVQQGFGTLVATVPDHLPMSENALVKIGGY